MPDPTYISEFGGYRRTATLWLSEFGGRRSIGYEAFVAEHGGRRAAVAAIRSEFGGTRGANLAVRSEFGGRRRAGYEAHSQSHGGRRAAILRYDQEFGGLRGALYAGANQIRIWADLDFAPDTDTLIAAGVPPFAVVADDGSFPKDVDITSLITDGDHSYYFDMRRFNSVGEHSGSAGIVRRRIRKVAAVYSELPLPPSRPRSAGAGALAGYVIRLQASYTYMLDTGHEADTWWVWIKDHDIDPVFAPWDPPDLEFPMGPPVDGVIKLDAELPGPYVPSGSSGFDVYVGTYSSVNELHSNVDQDAANGTVIASVVTADSVVPAAAGGGGRLRGVM